MPADGGKGWLKESLAWIAFAGLRGAERILPEEMLRIALFPLAALLLLGQRSHRAKLRRAFHQFPAELQPGRFRFLVAQPIRSHLARFLAFWPDRLSAPQWRKRCQIAGFTGWTDNRGRRPVILASLHFGPCVLLPYWLRALDIPAATLVGPLRERSSFRQRRYDLTPMPEVPVVFSVDELRQAREFLAAGNCLAILIDGAHGRRLAVPFENRALRIASGALRMAAAVNALVVPCLIVETAPWRFSIHCGEPVPEHLLHPERIAGAAAHLIGEFAPLIRQYPEQCEVDLLESLEPPTLQPVESTRGATKL